MASDEHTRNQLRMQIARLRRRVDARIHTIAGRAGSVLTLPRLLGPYPRLAILVALWAGRAVLANLRQGRPPRSLAEQFLRQAAGKAAEGVEGLWRKYRQYRARSRAKPSTAESDGVESAKPSTHESNGIERAKPSTPESNGVENA